MPTQSEREPLAGTVKYYERHLYVCTGRTHWPAKPDLDGGFIQALTGAVSARAAAIPTTVKITACDEPSQGGGVDLLLFPDRVRYLGLAASDLPALIEDHLVAEGLSPRLHRQYITTDYVFVCVHGERDERCGLCGPPLYEQFAAEIQARGLQERVTVRRSSHVGGHAFACNVLIYPPGDWYGYVQAGDIPRLIDRHLLNGETVDDLWRGRMGLAPQAQIDRTI